MPKPKNKASAAELNYRARRLTVLTDAFTRIFCTVLYSAVIVSVAGLVYLSISVLAGKHTEAKILLNAAADLKANEAFAYLFGVGGAAWG